MYQCKWMGTNRPFSNREQNTKCKKYLLTWSIMYICYRAWFSENLNICGSPFAFRNLPKLDNNVIQIWQTFTTHNSVSYWKGLWNRQSAKHRQPDWLPRVHTVCNVDAHPGIKALHLSLPGKYHNIIVISLKNSGRLLNCTLIYILGSSVQAVILISVLTTNRKWSVPFPKTFILKLMLYLLSFFGKVDAKIPRMYFSVVPFSVFD